MPEFMKHVITTDTTSIPLIPVNIDTMFNTTFDTVSNTETLRPTITSGTITNSTTDCKSYWMNRIILQKQQDINELVTRYNKTLTKQQIATMFENTGKYSEDVFHINEAELCARYEKLKNTWYFKLHASDPMIIDTSGVISFNEIKKRK